MPDGFAFLLQVALKIGAPAADNINWLAHSIINLVNVGHLSSAAESIEPGDIVADDQGVNIMRALVGVNAFQVHQMTNHGVAICDSDRAQNVTRFAGTLERHPDIVAFRQ